MVLFKSLFKSKHITDILKILCIHFHVLNFNFWFAYFRNKLNIV